MIDDDPGYLHIWVDEFGQRHERRVFRTDETPSTPTRRPTIKPESAQPPVQRTSNPSRTRQ